MRLRLSLFTLALTCFQFVFAKDFVWYDEKQPITYTVTNPSAKVICIALEMFADDMRQVTGDLPQQVAANNATIRIIQLDDKATSEAEKQELQKLGVPVAEIAAKRDAFFIAVLGKAKKQLYIVGSDYRGTAYGILELSRKAGVSPWVWWGDVTPEKKIRLTIPANFRTLQSPSVEFRGIFLNDEDWSLQPWSWKHFEPGEDGVIGAKTYKEIFKFLMRMRANAIWPGMHGITRAFYLVPGAKEAADSCGIVIGTAHCEPMMRNNVGEWDESIKGRYNYLTNKKQVIDYWTERLQEVRNYENIYTIGMRGIHDGPMEGVTTLDEQTVWLQKVIDDQRVLLEKYVNRDVTQIPQQFIPYKEVLNVMENGLVVPDDVILTWCDDNYGYMTRLSDAEQQKRSGGGGVYYHLNYWGRPHDYMWLCAIQPGLIYNEMKEAYNNNARRQWIVNVHDLKPAVYDLELFLDMAWDVNSITPSTLNKHHEAWLCREFGDIAGKKLLQVMLEFYRLCAIRKPEFMGWNQVELNNRIHPRGWSPVINTEFSLTEFGNELDRYLQDYESIKQLLEEIEVLIPEYRRDAFFGQVKYAVFGAAAMATKMLEAQRARTIAAVTPEAEWRNNIALMTACAKSQRAYNEIHQLTDYYNNGMSEGKWKYSMCENPRKLHVFDPPKLPVKLTEDEIIQYASSKNKQAVALTNLELDRCIVYNASNYSTATQGVCQVEALGHSMNAVSLPKGASITFDFDSAWEGEATLCTAVIPTQPIDLGDIRFSVSINGEEPQVVSFREKGRTETWKVNVLRGQARKETKHTMKKGQNKLIITALDNHVLIDQWMIDFKPDRKFYVFPVEVVY